MYAHLDSIGEFVDNFPLGLGHEGGVLENMC